MKLPKLLPIRVGLVLGNLVIIQATLLEYESDDEPEVVHNTTSFGFQVADDEVCAELESSLDPGEE